MSHAVEDLTSHVTLVTSSLNCNYVISHFSKVDSVFMFDFFVQCNLVYFDFVWASNSPKKLCLILFNGQTVSNSCLKEFDGNFVYR